MKVQDLPQNPPYGSLLLCRVCQGEYSATKGDYFLANPQQVMRCCGEPLAYVTKRTVYERAS